MILKKSDTPVTIEEINKVDNLRIKALRKYKETYKKKYLKKFRELDKKGDELRRKFMYQ